jgi:GDPmannose 4,6-dehydratase
VLVGLDWREYVVSDKGLRRPTDLAVSRGNPSKARERVGWVAKHKIADIVRLMILSRGEAISGQTLRYRQRYPLVDVD